MLILKLNYASSKTHQLLDLNRFLNCDIARNKETCKNI